MSNYRKYLPGTALLTKIYASKIIIKINKIKYQIKELKKYVKLIIYKIEIVYKGIEDPSL
jgi:hypothetical protein